MEGASVGFSVVREFLGHATGKATGSVAPGCWWPSARTAYGDGESQDLMAIGATLSMTADPCVERDTPGGEMSTVSEVPEGRCLHFSPLFPRTGDVYRSEAQSRRLYENISWVPFSIVCFVI